MDGRRFDAWVKRLPSTSPRGCWLGASRRGLLRGLVGSALTAVVGEFGGASSREAIAAGEGVCDKGCGTLCEPVPAQLLCNFTNPDCLCLKSTSGAVHCATSTRPCPAAGAADECQQDSDCAPNEICVTTAGGICCAETTEAQVNICAPKCLNLTTATTGRTRHGTSLIDGVRKRL
jgi:hypothetical protein